MAVGLPLALVLAAGAAEGKGVRWREPGLLVENEVSPLELVFEGCRPGGTPRLPVARDLRYIRGGRVLADGPDEFAIEYRMLPTRRGAVGIPAFEVATDCGRLPVAALILEVGGAHRVRLGGERGADALAQASMVLRARTERPWAGEVFEVELVVGIDRDRKGELVGPPRWNRSEFVAEDWDRGRPVRRAGLGEAARYRTRALVPEPGRATLAPVTYEMTVETGRVVVGQDGRRRELAVIAPQSAAVEVEVQPLPASAPPEFTGAVGQFSVTSDVSPYDAAVGEPVHWTLRVEGVGNWTQGFELAPRRLPDHTRTLRPRVRRELDEGHLFSGALEEELVFVPTRPGALELPAFRFVYFDPARGTYEVAEVASASVVVGGAELEPGDAALARVPRGPELGRGLSARPLGSRPLVAAAGLPVAALVLYAVWLGVARARARAPAGRKPTSREALRVAIERVRAAGSPSERNAALLAWQGAAAHALCVSLAAPTSLQLRAAISDSLGPEEADRWTALFRESERALYARRGQLADGWCERASTAAWAPLVLAAEARGRAGRTSRAGVVLGAVCALGGALLAVPPELEAASEGARSASATDVGIALERASARPGDWVSRFNLGLAYARDGAPERAFGQTLSAFLLRPGASGPRFNLALFEAEVAQTSPALSRFLHGGGVAALARLAPAVAWQAILLLSCTAACGAAALALRRGLGRPSSLRGGRSGPIAAGLIAAGLAGAIATVALAQYGSLARPGAALVVETSVLRRAPTEAEAAEGGPALEVGDVVVIERSFLDWVGVRGRDGGSGWVRERSLTPLYRPPLHRAPLHGALLDRAPGA